MDKRHTPLDVIKVEQPCQAPWEAMAGDDRSRYCSHCRKNVYNLSAMPRDEAERLVCEAAGGLCVRFSRGHDGAVLTLDYDPPAGGNRRGWRFWTGVGAVGAVLATAANGMLSPRGVVQGGAPVPAAATPVFAAPAMGFILTPTTMPTGPKVCPTGPVTPGGGDPAQPPPRGLFLPPVAPDEQAR